MIAEDFMENNSLRRNITGLELTDYARLRILFPDVRPEYFADLLGLNAVAPCKKSIEGKTQVERLPFRLGFEQPLPDPDALEYPAVARNTPFPRLFGLQEHEQEREDTPPETYLNAKPYSEESRSDSETEIAPELLSNWNEIWPWLHRLFRMGKTTNRLDIDSIVKHAAQRKPLSAIPWGKKVRWPQQFVLLVDWSRHLTSFYHDYFHLIHNLHAWFSGRLQTVFCLDSPRQQFSFNGKVYDSFPDNIVSQRILYLGDLGFLDKSQLSTDVWYSLCRRLSENNCDLIALLTVNPAEWSHPFSRFCQMHHWDSGCLRRSPEPPVVSGKNKGGIISEQQTEKLLAALSFAFEITPALVRRLRQEKGFGVSVEALVLQHEALKGNFYLFHWVSEEYRQYYSKKLKDESEENEKIWQLVICDGMEERLPIELQIEQRQKAGRPLKKNQEEFLFGLTKALDSDNDLQSKADSQQNAILDWIGRMSGRAGDEEWFVQTNILHSFYRKSHRDIENVEVPKGVRPENLPQWFRGQSQSRENGYIFFEDAGIICRNKPSGIGCRGVMGELSASQDAMYEIIAPGKNTRRELVPGRLVELPPDIQELTILAKEQTLVYDFLKCPSWASAIGRDRFGLFTKVQLTENEKEVSFIFRWIPPGSFLMGSPEDEPERYASMEGPQHRVSFAQGFWLAETACSQELWLAVMGRKNNPSRFDQDPQNPVESVSWKMVKEFIAGLNDLIPGLGARLPSESEWEYGCRAGTGENQPFWFGSELTPDKANYNGNYPYDKGKKGKYRKETVPVKAFEANPWGLYQVHGNVSEWCEDIWHNNYKDHPPDGKAWLEDGDSDMHVARGGSWIYDGGSLRSAYRNDWFLAPGLDSIGFRLARGPQESGRVAVTVTSSSEVRDERSLLDADDGDGE